jgi:hypothetical protein
MLIEKLDESSMANPNGNLANIKPWGANNPPPKSPGRPRKRPSSEANEDFLRMEIPEAWRRAMNSVSVDGVKTQVEILKPGATFADAISYGLGKKAMLGDPACAKELRESVEGRSVQRVELSSPEDHGFEFSVRYETEVKPVEVEAKEISRELTEVVEEKAQQVIVNGGVVAALEDED